MVELLLLLIALALVAACGAFVAAEFSFLTVDRPALERAAEAGDHSADGVLAALRSLSTQLSSAQVGITLTNLLIGFIAEPAIADLIDGPLGSAGVPDGAVTGVALVVALVTATTVTMVFGELVPKNLAIARPLQTAQAVQRFQRLFTTLFGPVIRLFNDVANALLRRMGVEPQEELASARSPEELSSLVRRSAEQGTLEPSTARLLVRSLAFSGRRAADVMTPRERMVVARPEDTVADVLRLARSTGRSRFPVLEPDTDAIAGVVHIKDAIGVPHPERGRVAVRTILSAPVLAPTTLELDELLPRLRAHGRQLALVVNEFGGLDGLVTLEDLVEEIVGEVRDEHDPQDDRIRAAGPGAWDVSGLLRPDEILRGTGVALPDDEDYETVAGLVAKLLEDVPAQGDAVETDHATLRVLALDGLRVDRVLLEVRG